MPATTQFSPTSPPGRQKLEDDHATPGVLQIHPDKRLCIAFGRLRTLIHGSDFMVVHHVRIYSLSYSKILWNANDQSIRLHIDISTKHIFLSDESILSMEKDLLMSNPSISIYLVNASPVIQPAASAPARSPRSDLYTLSVISSHIYFAPASTFI